MNENNFQYTYSSKEQEEVRLIREKYTAPVEETPDKMETLRRLDASVDQKATTASLVVGIVSALILGGGMAMVMEFGMMVPGVLIGAFGIAGVSLAYPVYTNILKKERAKIAPEILRLTDELMK